jgi:hypothetical protein
MNINSRRYYQMNKMLEVYKTELSFKRSFFVAYLFLKLRYTLELKHICWDSSELE